METKLLLSKGQMMLPKKAVPDSYRQGSQWLLLHLLSLHTYQPGIPVTD